MGLVQGFGAVYSYLRYSGLISQGSKRDEGFNSIYKSVDEVVLQRSIPAQIRQIIFYISNDKGSVDGFVQELTFA